MQIDLFEKAGWEIITAPRPVDKHSGACILVPLNILFLHISLICKFKFEFVFLNSTKMCNHFVVLCKSSVVLCKRKYHLPVEFYFTRPSLIMIILF